ncbi:phospho-N-acetylmuramoyl-pentapeptide-transferase [uncultured Clostridium sp.]|uniref:phospho-N-acetylmuramoyl-pentapeptide- transferase n=1 Tax=uncultured Clostridium sp. TaxID=59620 RepID=UPI002638AA4E|nr:phospho-N-acetylmuramoyl-pentapeptide-transferase [uncultured Clostridium sp.]
MKFSVLLISFFLSFIIGKLIIPLFKKLNLGQNIREEGLQTHLKKQGVLTFGGVIFIFSTIITFLIFFTSFKLNGLILSIILLLFALVGFLDDYLKKVKKINEGLNKKQKLILLILVSIISLVLISIINGTTITIFKYHITLGFLFIPLGICYLSGFANAVNFTDGLDGLCTSLSIIVLIFLSTASFILDKPEIGMFSLILVGSLFGFLIFNFYPAKIIMGDTGSLALGGIISSITIMLGHPLILIIVGIIYVIEILSVIIQIGSFKLFKKRIFKMAPIHHSFEIKGYSEIKIVVLFSLITLIFSIISYLILFKY